MKNLEDPKSILVKTSKKSYSGFKAYPFRKKIIRNQIAYCTLAKIEKTGIKLSAQAGAF
jgi:hypothetical protein